MPELHAFANAYTAYGVWGLGPVAAITLAIGIMLKWVEEITDDGATHLPRDP